MKKNLESFVDYNIPSVAGWYSIEKCLEEWTKASDLQTDWFMSRRQGDKYDRQIADAYYQKAKVESKRLGELYRRMVLNRASYVLKRWQTKD